MNKSSKQLFGAPWKAEEYKHGKGAFVVRNNEGCLVAENMSEQDAKRTAHLPEMYDALIYAVHDKCSSCGFAVATNPVDFCKDCKYKTFTDLLRKVKDGE